MITNEVRTFAMANNRAVLTTFRRSGAAQMSIVTSTPTQEGVSFTTTEDRAKYKNLARDSRSSSQKTTGGDSSSLKATPRSSRKTTRLMLTTWKPAEPSTDRSQANTPTGPSTTRQCSMTAEW